MSNRRAAIGLILLLIVIAAGVAVGIALRSSAPASKSSGSLPPIPGCPQGKPLGRLADPREFYLRTTTDGVVGRETNGDLVNNGTVVEKGFGAKSDLQAHLLTYAYGHPYYAPGTPGALVGGSWAAFAAASAPSLKKCGPTSAPDKVFVVEDGCRVCLDCDASFEGLVVRRGGVFLVGAAAAPAIQLRVQFLMIESGGLFQAGSAYDPAYRYEGKFTLLLASAPGGYGVMGCPASQYSYQVYAPGVVDDGTFTPYTGMTNIWNNAYGPKSVGVGFNGNYHLAGTLGPSADYQGTWNVWDAPAGGNALFDKSDRLSCNTDWLPSGYAATWAPLAVGSYGKGAIALKVQVPDGAPADYLSWWTGKQVVVLATPEVLASCESNQVSGILPIWLDDPDPAQAAANNADNDRYVQAHPSVVPSIGTTNTEPGVEVCTVMSVAVSGSTATLQLNDKLRYDHSAARTHLKRSFGKGRKDIYVDTVPHVCLLTRSIVVTSEFSDGDSGCNVLYNKSDLATSMGMSRSGREPSQLLAQSGMAHMIPMLAKEAPPTPVVAGKFAGPGGSVLCNNGGAPGGLGEIFHSCYEDKPYDKTPFCGPEVPGPAVGHWLWGTSGKKGCGAIHGGQQMFRYGSAVCLDSAEIFRMGTPGNFGAIGQYAIHFHLCGYAKSFRDFTPSRDHPRELRVANCAIWLSLSRWVTLHGTAEAEVSNNVGFFTLGSGYFVEDGPEFYNVFDHNVGAYAMPAVRNDYLNPSPVYPNVATDFGTMSVFWFKNNANVAARNVAACCPGATIGFWLVPQKISKLRGPATLPLGSEELGLPGFGSRDNAMLCHNSEGGLNQTGACNFPAGTVPSVGGTGSCWVPDDFDFPLIDPVSKCVANSSDNTLVPWLAFMENVVYACFMLLGEMPEMIEASSLNYDMDPGGSVGLSGQIQDNRKSPQWMPVNGQTRCTDRAVGTYSETIWSPHLAYQPLSETEITALSAFTKSQEQGARGFPKILSGCLSFSLGPFQNIWGGTGWAKQMACWILNCAFVDPAAPNKTVGIGQGATGGVVHQGCDATHMTTVFAQAVDAPHEVYNKMYPVFLNFITNGMMAPPPSPSLWLGDKTFLADTTMFFPNADESIFDATTCLQKYFCDFGDQLGIEDVFPNPITIDPAAVSRRLSVYIYDVRNSKLGTVDFSTGKWTLQPAPYPPGGNQTKFPFVCDGGKLRMNGNAAACYLVNRQFSSPQGLAMGDAICAGIFRIPPDLKVQSWP